VDLLRPLRKGRELAKLKSMRKTKKQFPPAAYAALLGIVAFLVYWFTLAPGIVWDPVASLVQPRFFSFSFSPLYFLLGSLWSRLGLLSGLAFRANLVSALFASLSVSLVYLAIWEVTQDVKPAFLGGLCLALFPKFWSFALFANFYTLAFFLFWLSLLFLFHFERRPRGALLWSTFFAALSFLCFPAAVFLAFPLGAVAWQGRAQLRRRGVLTAGLVFVVIVTAGLSAGLVLGLPVRAFVLSLSPLRPVFLSSWRNVLGFTRVLLDDLWWVLLPLAGLGFVFGGGSQALLIRSLLGLFAVVAIYPLPEMPGVYLPLFSVIILWASLGFKAIWDLALALSDTEIGAAFKNRVFVLVFRLKREGRVLRFLVVGALSLLAVAMTAWELPARFLSLSRTVDTEAALYGKQAWEVLPPGAIVLAEKEEYLSALRYFEVTERNRGILVTHPSLGFDQKEVARIRRFYPEVVVPGYLGSAETEADALAGLESFVVQNINDRAVFFTLSYPATGQGTCVGTWEDLPLVAEGPLYRIVR